MPCNMKLKFGDIEGEWMQVIDVDMEILAVQPKDMLHLLEDSV